MKCKPAKSETSCPLRKKSIAISIKLPSLPAISLFLLFRNSATANFIVVAVLLHRSNGNACNAWKSFASKARRIVTHAILNCRITHCNLALRRERCGVSWRCAALCLRCWYHVYEFHAPFWADVNNWPADRQTRSCCVWVCFFHCFTIIVIKIEEESIHSYYVLLSWGFHHTWYLFTQIRHSWLRGTSRSLDIFFVERSSRCLLLALWET